ncbi:MAG: PAS domain-containing sensor histidine kinase [Rhodospirillaceae bacterium]|nr:PAS domain-containing sensor histidine kinase [Rhodospirillaceae bacterium]
MPLSTERVVQLLKSIVGRRIAWVVFLSVIVIEIIILVPSYLRQTDQLLMQMDRQDELLFESLAITPHPDPALMEDHAKSLIRAKNIIGVYFSPSHQMPAINLGERPSVPLSSSEADGIQRQRNPNEHSYDVFWPKDATAFHHGVALRFDVSHIDDALTEYVLRISGLVLVIAAFVTLATMWVLKRQIPDSLFALRNGLLTGGGRDAVIPADGKNRQDELGDLYRSVQTMLDDVSEAHVDDKRDLQSFNEELEQRVQERTDELRQSEIRFHAFADAASDWFWEMDSQLRFSYFSERFTEITGVPQTALLGKTREETGIPDVDPTVWQEHLENLHNHQSFRSFIHPRIQSDGTTVYLAINGVPVYAEDGQFAGFRGTGRDITTAMEAEQSLRSAKEAAEHASQAKSTFLSSMSHELRTPLNAIIGFAQLMKRQRRSQLDDSTLRQVDEILGAGRQLLALIEGVLDLVQIESGEATSKLTSAVVADLLGDTLTEAQNLADQYAITVELKLSEGPFPEIITDRILFRQCMDNLLTNAIRYNATGGHVTVKPEMTSTGSMRINVIDDGPGIDKEMQRKVFTPFERLGHANSTIPGIGIGLTVTQRTAALLGGDVGFQSTAGEGSTFWLEIPVAEPSARNVASAPV